MANTAKELKRLSRALGTKGYRVIADGRQTSYKTLCGRLITELEGINGEYHAFKNMLEELAIDFDNSVDDIFYNHYRGN